MGATVAVAVALLAERQLLTAEICGLNPVIAKAILVN